MKLKHSIRRTYWRYEVSKKPVTLDNGVNYDMVKTKQLIEDKKKFLSQVK